MKYQFDIIVVGGGHAGCEAAVVAARMGAEVLLITADMNQIAQLSCNPAMGGIAKGQIVREIDALGGQSGRMSDYASIQFRMLNRSKGPAMWSPRAQLDRVRFMQEWRELIDSIENLSIWQDMAVGLILSDQKVCQGVRTRLGMEFFAPRVILTNGTFLGGLMHFGEVQIEGGRISEPSSHGLSKQLSELGLRVQRMKTGTPARIDGRSVDWSQTTPQEGDEVAYRFSFAPLKEERLRQLPCHIFYTNIECHDLLRESLGKAPLYNGQIQSVGPRYCPSIETKIVNFAERDRHQLFLEPESENSNEYYLNGFSSSLPCEVQIEALQKIPALKNVQLYRPGYAIEYDYFDPQDLEHTLESKIIPHLYLAGQINGTTGYEEAAAQGLLAGINAVLAQTNRPPLILKRNEAYIGVLIDDLITKGVDEPYRMFTSRAEYRILLRQDNADERLTPIAITLGLADEERISRFHKKRESIAQLKKWIEETSVKPNEVNALLERVGEKSLSQGMKVKDLLLRPNLSIELLRGELPRLDEAIRALALPTYEVVEGCEIAIKYQGYIEREKQQAEKLHRLENISLRGKFDYSQIDALPLEAREKLKRVDPQTIAEASRIPGISPNDISILLVLLGR